MTAAREVATARAMTKESQLGSAFTREEAAAGCAELDDDDEEEGLAGESGKR